MKTRTEIARELDIAPQLLIAWENAGIMPRFRPSNARLYRIRARLIVAARGELSMQEVRMGLSEGGF